MPFMHQPRHAAATMNQPALTKTGGRSDTSVMKIVEMPQGSATRGSLKNLDARRRPRRLDCTHHHTQHVSNLHLNEF
jgi:hypothetical protein